MIQRANVRRMSRRFWERELHLCNLPCQKPSEAKPEGGRFDWA